MEVNITSVGNTPSSSNLSQRNDREIISNIEKPAEKTSVSKNQDRVTLSDEAKKIDTEYKSGKRDIEVTYNRKKQTLQRQYNRELQELESEYRREKLIAETA